MDAVAQSICLDRKRPQLLPNPGQFLAALTSSLLQLIASLLRRCNRSSYVRAHGGDRLDNRLGDKQVAGSPLASFHGRSATLSLRFGIGLQCGCSLTHRGRPLLHRAHRQPGIHLRSTGGLGCGLQFHLLIGSGVFFRRGLHAGQSRAQLDNGGLVGFEGLLGRGKCLLEAVGLGGR